MELWQLRYFLGVATHGSIAAAARQLHIAQPALSRQISALEASVGARLFDRLPRGVSLTRAGEALQTRARELLAQAQALEGQVSAAVEGMAGTLRIGVMPGYSWLPSLSQAIVGLQEASPAVGVSIVPALSAQQFDALKRHEIDVGLVAFRSPLDASITGRPVYQDRMAVAIPRGLRLAKRAARLKLKDLADQTFIAFPRERSPAHYDTLRRAFMAAGMEPSEHRISVADIPTIVGLVAAGLGCAVVPRSFEHQCPRDVVLREAEGLDISFELELVWRARNDDPLLLRFVDLWPFSVGV